MSDPTVTICVLLYGDYARLARQAIGSVITYCQRSDYRLVVGANEIGAETRRYLTELWHSNAIDYLVMSATNLHKIPMMRRMFAGVDTEFLWWFDDDAYVTRVGALERRLEVARAAPPNDVMWGHQYYFRDQRFFNYGVDASPFVRTASWYRGLNPPDWKLAFPDGDAPEEWLETETGRWWFLAGGGWFARTSALRAIDWPDPRLIRGVEDVLMGEAIRQQGWVQRHFDDDSFESNNEPRRGPDDNADTMRRMVYGTLAEAG